MHRIEPNIPGLDELRRIAAEWLEREPDPDRRLTIVQSRQYRGLVDVMTQAVAMGPAPSFILTVDEARDLVEYGALRHA